MMVGKGAPHVCIDANGVGSSPYDFLNATWPRVMNCFFQGSPGDLQAFEHAHVFLNLRAALWWLMRKVLDPERGLKPMLPFDNILRSELVAPKFNERGGKMVIEDKDEIKTRLGYSTDNADAVILSLRNISTMPEADRLKPFSAFKAVKVTEPAETFAGDWMAM